MSAQLSWVMKVRELEAEIARLRAALKVIAGHDGPDTTYVWFDEPRSRDIARKALEVADLSSE